MDALVNGAILIGGNERQRDRKFRPVDPATGELGPHLFSESAEDDVAEACARAEVAFGEFSSLAPEMRAAFLETAADRIGEIGEDLITTAMAETALGRARLEGERERTVNQLLFFATVARQGDWLEATIDPAKPERSPPRPDLRRMNIALGPVAVFGASNFPLAFSVAGGDTAAAFAAGCPVVVKGHPAHPGTGELVARAINAAAAMRGLPEGVFSYLPGSANTLGVSLVSNPNIKAVGFTGSRAAGLALVRIAEARPEPIPVYAEMGSVNPVILLPAALATRAGALGEGFAHSLTLGVGQFCTNPGLVIALPGPDLDRFMASASAALAKIPSGVMLNPNVHANYELGLERLTTHSDVLEVASGDMTEGPNRARSALYQTQAASFLRDGTLSEEVFGPSSLIVCCQNLGEVGQVLAALEGQLTISIQADRADEPSVSELLPHINRKAGRLIFNGWPTGVEIAHAMVHGGPHPATSDGRNTSVGSLAMMRFLRPLCCQDFPEALLPPALKSTNPWSLSRRVEGKMEAGRQPALSIT